jgi:hypothetical protein
VRPGDHGKDPWEGTEPERPIDIEALRADDAFIESLLSGEVQKPVAPVARGEDVEAELRSMLAAWVLDVRPETVTAVESALPATSTAPAELLVDVPPAVPLPDRRRSRFPVGPARRLLLAASVVAAVGSGLAFGAYQSEPGGTLWPVTKVLYAEHARSVQAAADVTTGLDRARVALREGRPAEAAEAIRAVRMTLGQVAPAQGRDELDQIQLALSEELATVAPALAATLDLPPDPDPWRRSPITVLDTAAPAPLTDRAAEAGSSTAPAGPSAPPAGPSAPAAVVPAPVVPDPVVPAPVVPDPVVPAPVVPDPVVPDLVAPPDPEPSTGGSGRTDPSPSEPAAEPPPPPVVPTPADANPPAATTDGATGATDSTSPAPADAGPGAASAPADAAPAVAVAPDAAPAYAEAPPDGSLAGSLLTTVANAASETAQNVGAAAGT